MAAQIAGLQYDNPLPFTARQQFILSLGPPVVAAAVRLLSCTCRHELLGLDHWEHLKQTRGKAIVAVWHETTALAVYHYRQAGVHSLASHSFDAEWASRAVRRLGILTVRGSSSNGGGQALRDLAVVLEQAGTVMLTVDGPRGPRRVAKPGAAILSARTGVPIIPHAFAVRPAWRLGSWDRLSIAKPFSRVISAYGPAIPPPANDSRAAVEETRLLVETGLNQAHQQIEAMLGIETEEPARSVEESVHSVKSSNQ